MLFSIISINYNNKFGLEKTIASVVHQTYSDFEYIIIDGNSKDGSKETIEKYNDDIDYWVSEPDNGIYHAMNKGIAASKGDYLLFLNSGDWLFNNDVLNSVSHKLTNCDILYGNLVKVFKNGKSTIDKGINGKNITLYTFFTGTINHPSSFINRNLFYKYGFYDEQLKIVSDWKFFLIAIGLNDSKVIYMDLEISYFDMDGVSNANLNSRNLEREKVLKELIPVPIYNDYENLRKLKTQFNSRMFKMTLNLEMFLKNIIKK